MPEELARDVIAHEDEAPGGKVRMTFRVLLTRAQAETLVARAIREAKNLETLVTEILEAAAEGPAMNRRAFLSALSLGGHPKPASCGHLKPGQ